MFEGLGWESRAGEVERGGRESCLSELGGGAWWWHGESHSG